MPIGLRNPNLARVLIVEHVEVGAGAPEDIAQHHGAIEPRLLDWLVFRLLRRIFVLQHAERITRGALQRTFEIFSNRRYRKRELFGRRVACRGRRCFECGELQILLQSLAQLPAETIQQALTIRLCSMRRSAIEFLP